MTEEFVPNDKSAEELLEDPSDLDVYFLRKRKHNEISDDNMSVCSMTGDPENKRARRFSLAKVAAFSSKVFSPVVNSNKKLKRTLQKSFSLKNVHSPTSNTLGCNSPIAGSTVQLTQIKPAPKAPLATTNENIDVSKRAAQFANSPPRSASPQFILPATPHGYSKRESVNDAIAPLCYSASSMSNLNVFAGEKAFVHPSTSDRTSSLALGGTPKRRPATPSRPRLWHEAFPNAMTIMKSLSDCEVKRHNAVFEVLMLEEEFVDDLKLLKKNYFEPLQTLGLLSASELNVVFGNVFDLAPLHQELVADLREASDEFGRVRGAHAARSFVSFVASLEDEYAAYCPSLVFAKACLDEKLERDARLADFLERCQISPFSRRLGLSSFVDAPRVRLVKYPLHFKRIQDTYSSDEEEYQLLAEAIARCNELLSVIDRLTGEARCQFILARFDTAEPDANNADDADSAQRAAIAQQRSLLCEGTLRNNRGTKLMAFLFDGLFVLARFVRGTRRYQLYRIPIRVDEAFVEDVRDGDVKMGSFKNTFITSHDSKFVFKIANGRDAPDREKHRPVSRKESGCEVLPGNSELSRKPSGKDTLTRKASVNANDAALRRLPATESGVSRKDSSRSDSVSVSRRESETDKERCSSAIPATSKVVAYTLQCENEHDKQAWISAFRGVLSDSRIIRSTGTGAVQFCAPDNVSVDKEVARKASVSRKASTLSNASACSVTVVTASVIERSESVKSTSSGDSGVLPDADAPASIFIETV